MAAAVTIQSHCGELLQGRLGRAGPLVLVSLPAPHLALRIRKTRDGSFGLYQPQGRVLCPERIAQLFKALRLPRRGGFTLHRDMERGAGCGSSTAALLALARAAGSDLSADDLARILWRIEGASDPLMFATPERILWASREARVIARLPALPAMQVIAGLSGPPHRTDPADVDYADISDLVAAWQRGGSAADHAQLAARCASRQLSHRGVKADRTEALADRAAALGYAIAYTGSARALILDKGADPRSIAPMLRAAGWRQIRAFTIGAGGGTPASDISLDRNSHDT